MTKKILVVDDSSTVRQQVGILLTEAGYLVVQAANGLAGIEMIRVNPDLSMVVCDVHMPVMSGLDLLQRLKDEAAVCPPVLMLTTDANPASVGAARSAGARGWIVKPFKPEIFLACVRKVAGDP